MEITVRRLQKEVGKCATSAAEIFSDIFLSQLRICVNNLFTRARRSDSSDNINAITPKTGRS